MLTEDEITTILEGRPVIAPPREVQEVRNAFGAYDAFPQWNPAREADLLRAHEMLMMGLLDAPGHYRHVGVAVGGGGEVHHIGPPADRVPHLMANLLSWLGGTDEHPLIASSVFHYEFEFIHPFEDGNGRMGRLWQTVILTRWNPLFAWMFRWKAWFTCASERRTTRPFGRVQPKETARRSSCTCSRRSWRPSASSLEPPK